VGKLENRPPPSPDGCCHCTPEGRVPVWAIIRPGDPVPDVPRCKACGGYPAVVELTEIIVNPDGTEEVVEAPPPPEALNPGRSQALTPP
jgi:hypothetical protein